MKTFLTNIKLVDYLQTELEIPKREFVKKLKANVDKGSTSIFFSSFDMFSTSKKEYKGEVNESGFKIKRKRKFFDMNFNLAVAKGKITQEGDHLIINTEINGFNNMMIPFYILCILAYGVLIPVSIFANNIDRPVFDFFLPFILVHATFMMGIPYFVMRRSTSRLKYDLEREFYFLTK